MTGLVCRQVPLLLLMAAASFAAPRFTFGASLDEVPPNRRLDVLVEELHSPDTIVRLTAIETLSDMGAEAAPAVPALVRMLTPIDETENSTILRVLECIGPAGLPGIARTFWEVDEEVQCQLGVVVQGMGSQAIPELIELLKNEDLDVRCGALPLLSSLVQPVPTSPEEKLAVSCLLKALENDEEKTREAALLSLQMTWPETIPAWRAGLYDPSAEVRRSVMRLVGGVAARDTKGEYREHLLPLVIEALENDDVEIRNVAFYAIHILGPRAIAAAPALLDVVESCAEEERVFVVSILLQVDPPRVESVSVFQEMLSSDNEGLRYYAAWALRCLGPEAGDAVPALTSALEDEAACVREAAALALAEIEEGE